MDGTPAGWYDDPEQPGQQRYWDGTAWTEQRAPGAQAAPAPAAPAPAAPAAPAPPATSSKKVLWIVLSVVGVLVVMVIVAAVAIFALAGDDATEVVEKNLPAALEENLSSKGLDVTVSDVSCRDISDSDGPFTTPCEITIEGLATPFEATVYGSIDGSTVNVEDVQADNTLINADLATEQVQTGIRELDPTVDVESCTLPGQVVVVTDGLTFSCAISTGETVTIEVEDGGLTITNIE